MQIKTGMAALAASAAMAVMAAASSAQAAGPVTSWSYAESHIGYCQFNPEGCTPAHVFQTNSVTDQGRDYNALADANNTARGRALGWVSNDSLLPDLHAFALTKTATGQGNFAVTLVEAAQAFTWNGPTLDLHADDLQATIHYIGNNNGSPANSIIAGFALLDASVIADPSLGAAWFDLGHGASGPPTGAFNATCATPGAIGIANGGAQHTSGEHSSTLGATDCGDGLLHLETGTQFVIWEKLWVDENSPGALDATHTFSLSFASDVPPATQQLVASNLSVASFRPSIPEPGTWALMILGFGATGAALRRRTAIA